MWFYHCSSQKDIEKLRKDKFDLKFSLLIEGIEKECGKGVSKPKKENWSNLNSLTHAGAAQISRRVEDTCIKSSYSDDFVKDTLNFANNYALLCAGELAKISNNVAAQECVLEIAKKLELR
ncbi:MAG: hypothetical protein JKY90_02080 [Gammaproteobacteria bacterium]|nr:hypothetical protein [Gammaproteobacteria bacterium]